MLVWHLCFPVGKRSTLVTLHRGRRIGSSSRCSSGLDSVSGQHLLHCRNPRRLSACVASPAAPLRCCNDCSSICSPVGLTWWPTRSNSLDERSRGVNLRSLHPGSQAQDAGTHKLKSTSSRVGSALRMGLGRWARAMCMHTVPLHDAQTVGKMTPAGDVSLRFTFLIHYSPHSIP